MDKEIYQEFIIELYKNPINFGKIDNPDLEADVYNATCGDKIKLYVKLKHEKIIDVKFNGKGCAISQASASLFTEHIKGKSIKEVSKMNKEDILKLIKIDLSKNPTRIRCALLVFDAFKKAIKDLA